MIRILLAAIALYGAAPDDSDDADKVFAAMPMPQQLKHPSIGLPQPFNDTHRGQSFDAVYQVCVERDGTVSAVTTVHGLGDAVADESVMMQIKNGWTYQPQPARICFHQTLRWRSPNPATKGVKLVAAFKMTPSQLNHAQPQLPAAFSKANAGRTLQGTYKVCVGLDGRVFDVSTVSSLGDGSIDQSVMSQIQQLWTYQPQPEKACFLAVVKFAITPDSPDGGTPQPPKKVLLIQLTREQITHKPPTLPWWFNDKHPHSTIQARYEVCLDMSGHVSSVKTINSVGDEEVDRLVANQIKSGWTYNRQLAPSCFSANLNFNIN